MAGFLYWWPDHTGDVTLARAKTAGLAYAFDAPPKWSAGYTGPDDRRGVVFGQDVDTKIDRASQTWRKIPKSPVDAWVGYENDAKPGPEDLIREQQIDGHVVKLLDGREWLIPVARAAADGGDPMTAILRGSCRLPRRVEQSDDGDLIAGPVFAEYDDLWALAERWFDVWLSAAVAAHGREPTEDGGVVSTVDMGVGELVDGAVRALSVNGR